MVGPGVTELGEAVAADVGLGAFLGWIVNLELTFASCVTIIPLGAGGLVGVLLLMVIPLLELLFSDISGLGDSLDCLHHGGWVKLARDARPGKIS